MLDDINIGDTVRVDGDSFHYRVDRKNRKTGMLFLEALNAYPRVTLEIHEFQVRKVGAF